MSEADHLARIVDLEFQVRDLKAELQELNEKHDDLANLTTRLALVLKNAKSDHSH